MNEEFAVEPVACSTPAELIFLLRQFGLFGGRYIVRFPEPWGDLLKDHISGWPDGLDKQAAKRQLGQANEECAFVGSGGRTYSPQRSWIENVDVAQKSSARFDHVVAHPRHGKYSTAATFDFGRGTAPEIHATATGIVGVARRLLDVSPELALIDPLFNPCEGDKRIVLHELLAYLAKRNCTRVDIWIHEPRRNQRNSPEEKIQVLAEVVKATGFAHTVRLFLVTDKSLGPKGQKFRFHRRYMLSIYGAIDFDMGFQQLPAGELVPVNIVNRDMHERLVKRFLQGQHGSYSVEEPREVQGVRQANARP